MDRVKLMLLLLTVLMYSCNSIKNEFKHMEPNQFKYLIEKTLYWNHYIELISTSEDEATKTLLQYEKELLKQDGTLNFLADENLDKHRELTNYLKDSLNIKNEFKLNDSPYILADFKMPNTLSLDQTREIIEIAGKQIYKLHKLKKAEDGYYCILFSEDYGFENFQNAKIYQTLEEAQSNLTKLLTIQIAHNRPKFVDVDEMHSKSTEFKQFKSEINYFYFYDGYLIFQPKKETIENLEQMSKEELMEVQLEIDKIIRYSNSENVYQIQQI